MPRHPASRSTPARPASPRTGTGSIRLISGQWKGRKLPVLDAEGLRPTTDRVKETLFNWLAADIRDSVCLDLFAGSGSLGFEALSRYAQHVIMVEKEPRVAAQLRGNLARLQASNARIEQQAAEQFLMGPATACQVVFLDPPFRQGLLEQVCQLLEQGGWLAAEALIYLEREREGAAPVLPATWQLIKDKQAGQVCYQLYRREAV